MQYILRTFLPRHAVALLLCTVAVTGCGTQSITSYSAEKPAFELRNYFNGTLDAWGIFTDRSGKVVKRFTVVMTCTWNGDEGVLDEDFTYSDGTKQRRVWRLKQLPDGKYTGRADDVVGVASGQQAGNAFNWTYTMALPVDGTVYEVQFDDWMYLMAGQKIVLNKATMSKFGVKLGEVTLSFTRR